MLDFNSKKEILRRLHTKGQRNFFMYVPCAVAAFFVKAWYAIVCRADMALSDKEGNLLGIKGLGERGKTPKKDDVVYVRKPFFGRFVSAVLAFSMLLMLVPAVDLGLSIPVNAEITDFVKVKTGSDPDTYVEYYIDTKRSNSENTYLFKKTDYDTVKTYQVGDVITYEISDRAVRVSWTYDPEGKIGQLVGFEVELVMTDTVGTRTVYDEIIKQPSARMQVISSNELVSEEGTTINVRINPITNLDEWRYEGKLTSGGEIDDTVESDTHIAMVDDKFEVNRIVTDEKNVREGGSQNFDASFDIPAVRVNDGEDVTYDSQAIVEWEAVQQKGGNSAGTKPDGYNLYRKEGNGSFELYKRDLDPSKTSFTDTEIVPGVHYQYFVEAYRVVWGSSNKKYNTSNIGMITSSGMSVEADGDGKFGSVYSGHEAHLYVAPLAPSLTVEPSSTENKNTINVKSDPNGNIYNGVYIFRTKGEKPIGLEDAREYTPDLKDEKFGEWLYNMFVKGAHKADFAEYEPVSKGQFNNPSSFTYEDTDIISKQTYCYYVISYIMKGNTPIYSSTVAFQTSSLNINLDPPVAIVPTKGDGQTVLKWDPVSGAQGYEIEITMTECHKHGDPKECRTEEYITQVRNLGNVTTFTHNYLYNNDRYTYRVRAYKNVQSVVDGVILEKTYSNWSFPANVTVGVPLSQPLNVSASTVDGAVTVKWDQVSGADSYTLFWRNLTDGTSGSFAGLTNPTYTHTNLINDQRYTYWVVAYKHIDGDSSHETPQEIPSGDSNSVTLKVGQGLGIPQDLEASTTDGQISVSWSDVDGAEGYILQYRRQGEQWATFTDHNDLHNIEVTSTEFNHTRLNNGDIYEYRVIAFKTVSGERVYSEPSIVISMTVGDVLDTPKDFTVTTTDGTANLSWTASKGAEGYIVYAASSSIPYPYQFDVSKNTYVHNGLINGDTWTYYVVAYKTVNGSRTYSQPTKSISVKIGISMTAAVDLTATPGNRQVLLEWSEVTGAEGYAVYLYNDFTMEYEPITVTSETQYLHRGLTNGKNYRYMVAAYKTVGGQRVYGEYSMPVDAIPMAGNLDDIDRELTIKGTAPYGISHGEYISAAANHGAFDQSVDVYFTTSDVSTQTIREILNGYADGIGSFIVYPFDISIYQENTRIEMEPNNGYSVTITMPIPDRLIAYRDYITVIHINEDAGTEEVEEDEWYNTTDRRMEVLPAAVLDIDNVWCIQFEVSSFSPFAIVIYKDHISDVSSGGGVADGMFAGNFNSGLLLFTGLPDILLNNNKLRVVSGGRKKYRVKSIDKIVK